MREYVTDAIVLDRDPTGEKDLRITLFTERFGKVIGKAKSARNITSKLSAHLEQGTKVRVRYVEKKGIQIVDALGQGKISFSPASLHSLARILPEEVPEPGLWEIFTRRASGWGEILAVLGWDPLHVRCELCGGTDYMLFHIPTQKFFCANCASKLPAEEVLYMDATP